MCLDALHDRGLRR